MGMDNGKHPTPYSELGQRHSAVMSTGLYLKLNEYLSGQKGPLYLMEKKRRTR